MNDSKIDRLLELSSQRGVEAEVYYLDSQDTKIEFASNRLKSLSTKSTEGVALRVIAEGRLGFASASDLERSSDLVDAAIAAAGIGDRVKYTLAEGVYSIEPESNYLFPSTVSLTTIGKELIDRVLVENSEILVDLEFHLRNNRVIVATTKDAYIERNRRTVSASIAGNLVRGEDFLQIDADRIIRDGEPDYQILVEKLLQQYRRASQTATMSSGTYPVLFTPEAAASIIGRGLTAIFSGRAIAEKSSAVADKLGRQLFDERVTVFEDPNRGVAACGFDDEGTSTQYKTLIDRGFVNDFYWDKRWAAQVGKQSSGNGFRGGLSLPSPSLVNLCLNPGNSSVEDLIASIDEGIIVDRILGGGQSNLLAGEFSVSLALGYKVVKGEIVGRVKNTMVAGNIFQVLDRIQDFSDRCEWVGSRFYLPHILCSQLGVASKQ